MLQAFGLSYEPSPLTGKLFDDVRLSIASGEKVVLMGKNGSGKTKLLEILAGLIRPAEGRVVYDSRCRIGYLPQDIAIGFDGTLEEFLIQDGEPPGGLARVCARMGPDPEALEQFIGSTFDGAEKDQIRKFF